MIHLVLQADRIRFSSSRSNTLPSAFLRAHAHACGAFHFLEHVRHRQAAFFRHLDAVRQESRD
jgi:hypothetical protein